MKITFLSDNKTENSSCMAEWGLSFLIESDGHKILFDVGASPLFSQNATALGIDLGDVEAVVISHGHYDHTEGMEEFCRINKTAPIYIHKNAISAAYGTDSDGNIEDENCGIRWNDSFVEAIKDRLIFTENTVKIFENMTIMGSINPLKPMTETFYRPTSGGFLADDMSHEQVLVIKEDDGIHIISGCSHTGIESIIAHVKGLFKDEKIISIAAGMHLYCVSAEQVEEIAESMEKLGIQRLYPVHCTGMEAIMILKEKFGKRCVIASAGDSYEC